MQTGISFRGLISDLKQQINTFIRQETRLARREIIEKVSLLGKNSVRVAVGGIVVYAGLIVFLGALGLLLTFAFEKAGLQRGLAAFVGLSIVGLVVITLGALMALAAIKSIKQQSLTPEKTIGVLQRLKGEPPQSTSMQHKQKSHVATPSSEALEMMVLQTEGELAETVEELTDRVSLHRFTRKAENAVRTHPYRWSLAAAVLGMAGGYLLERGLLHSKARNR
jgi:hypothetical protein